jgi:hypothetical protein
MSMPKGFKSENGYATSKSLNGKTYHEIAALMKENGYKMNHSTVRNIFIRALIKIANQITTLYGMKLSDAELKKIAIDPRFQESIVHFLHELKE